VRVRSKRRMEKMMKKERMSKSSAKYNRLKTNERNGIKDDRMS
jgi:hypothetical protein